MLSYSVARRLFLERAAEPAHKGRPRADMSIEHVVTQSQLRRCGQDRAVSDMHNFLAYPIRLNQARSCSRLVNERAVLCAPTPLRLLDAEGREVCGPWSAETLRDDSLSWSTRSMFVPPRRLRGRIARAVAYMHAEYPELNRDAQPVMDAATMLEWHVAFPVDEAETRMEAWVKGVQGQGNLFVKRPELLLRQKMTRMVVNTRTRMPTKATPAAHRT